MEFQFMDFEISMGLFPYFTWDILLGISDLGFKQDFSSDFSLLRTPRYRHRKIRCVNYARFPKSGHINGILAAN